MFVLPEMLLLFCDLLALVFYLPIIYLGIYSLTWCKHTKPCLLPIFPPRDPLTCLGSLWKIHSSAQENCFISRVFRFLCAHVLVWQHYCVCPLAVLPVIFWRMTWEPWSLSCWSNWGSQFLFSPPRLDLKKYIGHHPYGDQCPLLQVIWLLMKTFPTDWQCLWNRTSKIQLFGFFKTM